MLGRELDCVSLNMRRSGATRSEAQSLQTSKGRVFSLQQSASSFQADSPAEPRSKASLLKDDLEQFLTVTRDEETMDRKALDYRETRLKRTTLASWQRVYVAHHIIQRADFVLIKAKMTTLFAGFITLRKHGFLREPVDTSIHNYWRKKVMLRTLTGWSRVMVSKYHEVDLLSTESPRRKQRTVKIVRPEPVYHETLLSFGDSNRDFKQVYRESRYSQRMLKRVFTSMADCVKRHKSIKSREGKLRDLKLVKRVFALWIMKERKIRGDFQAGIKTLAAFFACSRLHKAFINWRTQKPGSGLSSHCPSLVQAQFRLPALSDEDLVLEISALEKTLASLQSQISLERHSQARRMVV